MKKILKTILFTCLLTVIFAVPVHAQGMADTADGKKVVLNDFKVSGVRDKYCNYDSEINGVESTKEELMSRIDLSGAKCFVSYSVGGKKYDVTVTLRQYYQNEDEINWGKGMEPEPECYPGIDGAYPMESIKMKWEKVDEEKDDCGDVSYRVKKTKDNAIIFSLYDKSVRIPVNCNAESPIASVKIINNPLKDGIYGYQYNKACGSVKNLLSYSDDLLRIQITYNDGRKPKEIKWKKSYYDDKEIDGLYMSVSEEPSGDGTPGVDFKKFYLHVSSANKSAKVSVPIMKSPVKKMTIVKAPDKKAYKLLNDRPDLYGAKLKIQFKDGKTSTIKIDSHKTKIPVNNKYKESIYLSYNNTDRVSIDYMGATAYFNTKVMISSMGNSKGITRGEKNVTFDGKKMGQMFVFEPTESAKYKVSLSGKRIRLKPAKKNGKEINPVKKLRDETEAKIYVIDSTGKLMGNVSVEDVSKKFKFTKGKKYYFYLVTDSDLYCLNDNGKAIAKVEMSIGLKK